jgi:hypothetical protein
MVKRRLQPARRQILAYSGGKFKILLAMRAAAENEQGKSPVYTGELQCTSITRPIFHIFSIYLLLTESCWIERKISALRCTPSTLDRKPNRAPGPSKRNRLNVAMGLEQLLRNSHVEIVLASPGRAGRAERRGECPTSTATRSGAAASQDRPQAVSPGNANSHSRGESRQGTM